MYDNTRCEMILDIAAAIFTLVALFMALVWAPTEATMGHLQRIFYFHVSCAWVGFFAFFVTFLASILYLWRAGPRWDRVAASSAEIGLTFVSMAIVTGSIWAKPIWNTWWTWDPRLTTSAILWIIYVAYLMLRTSLDEPARRARFAAVYGILAFISVPITFMAIHWWRTIHPVILQSEGFALAGQMLVTLLAALAAFTLLYFALLYHRLWLAQRAEMVAELRERIKRRAW